MKKFDSTKEVINDKIAQVENDATAQVSLESTTLDAEMSVSTTQATTSEDTSSTLLPPESTDAQQAVESKRRRKSADCKFYDNKIIALLSKFGFIPFAVFAVLSIVFSIMNIEWWKNGLNVFFMSLAVLCYGLQKTIEFVYSKKCGCNECKSEYNPLIMRMALGYVLFTIGIICFAVFYGKVI